MGAGRLDPKASGRGRLPGAPPPLPERRGRGARVPGGGAFCLPSPAAPPPPSLPPLRPSPLPLELKPPPGPSGTRAPALVLFGLGEGGGALP